MNRTALTRFTFLLSTVLTTAALPALAQQPAVPAHWAGTATVRGQEIPVRIDLAPGTHGNITGSFRNGDEISTSSSGVLNGGHLILHFDYFARKLEGELAATTLTATYGGATGQPATLALHPDLTAAAKATPGKTDASLDGDWEVAVQSPKGESAWTLRISPFGEPGHIKAVILRIDGDTGGLYGSYDPAQGAYVVSRFAASGGSLYTIKPQTDGTLLLATTSRQNQQWTARRPAEARKENLAPPPPPPPPPPPQPAHRADRPHRSCEVARILRPRPRYRHYRTLYRSAVQRQGRDRRHRRKLVPQLPRRSALPGGTLQSLPRPRPRNRQSVL